MERYCGRVILKRVGRTEKACVDCTLQKVQSTTVFGRFFLNTPPHLPDLWDLERMLWVTFFGHKFKGNPVLFSTDRETGSWFSSSNINTRELHATRQLPSRYPFPVLSLKIQRCPRSCPRCIFKNNFPFFPVSTSAFCLAAFLICFPFTPWLRVPYLQSCL